MRDHGKLATAGDIVISVFQPDLTSNPQIFPIPGGYSGSLNVYLAFSVTPSSGVAAIERRKPGSDVWESLSGVSVINLNTAPISLKIDGGVSAIRLTMVGMNAGPIPTLAVVDNQTATPPKDLLTDGGFGPSRRIRVDPGQTGFFAGRMFRAFIDGVIPVAGPSVQFRFTSPIDFILWSQDLDLTQGALQLEVYTGATPSGVWTSVPVIGLDRMTERPQPYYVAQCTVETGGNFSGGTRVDVMKVRTSSTNGNASNVGGDFSERGLPATVFYGRLSTLTGGLTVNDAAQYVYQIAWEERVANS